MWRITLDEQEPSLFFDREVARAQLGKRRPLLCAMIALKRHRVSLGDLRLIKGWHFIRDEARRGPRLKPRREEQRGEEDTLREYTLRKPGVYIVDSVDALGARAFYYVEVGYEDVHILTREASRERLFERTGDEEFTAHLAARAWTKAWSLAQCAPAAQRGSYESRCIEAVRDAMMKQGLVTLIGQAKQVAWADRLRDQAVELVRLAWRSLRAHPTLHHEQPRLAYALVTCAHELKTQPLAKLFIAADYHITRGRVGEVVERFSALGRVHALSATSFAPPLSQEEVLTLKRLIGAYRA